MQGFKEWCEQCRDFKGLHNYHPRMTNTQDTSCHEQDGHICALCDKGNLPHFDCVNELNKQMSPPTSGQEWEKDIWMTKQPSRTTNSGWEVLYDPNALIEQIRSLLAKERKLGYEAGIKDHRSQSAYEAAKREAQQDLIDAIDKWVAESGSLDWVHDWDLFKARLRKLAKGER